jgi:Zn-dependent protease with chaperone function
MLKREGSIFIVRDGQSGLVHTQASIRLIDISARVGSIPRELTFPDGSLFETNDNDAIDRLLGEDRNQTANAVNWLEQFRPRLLVIAGAAILLGVATYRLALPVLVEVAILVTPPIVPNVISSTTLQALDTTVFSPSNLQPSRQQEIRNGFDTLISHTEGGAEHYQLNFRKGGVIGPNAFALPDGTLVLTDELVSLAGDDTEMILGVLAHEIGHVEHQHSLRQLYRAAGVAGLTMLIAGDIGSAMEDILTQGGGVLALSYSRDAESEADRRSVELMRKAGMDGTAIERFFAVLEEKFGDHSSTSMLSTHPGTPQRRQDILDYDKSLQHKPAG